MPGRMRHQAPWEQLGLPFLGLWFTSSRRAFPWDQPETGARHTRIFSLASRGRPGSRSEETDGGEFDEAGPGCRLTRDQGAGTPGQPCEMIPAVHRSSPTNLGPHSEHDPEPCPSPLRTLLLPKDSHESRGIRAGDPECAPQTVRDQTQGPPARPLGLTCCPPKYLIMF